MHAGGHEWAHIRTERFNRAHLILGSIPKPSDKPTTHVPHPGTELIVEHGRVDCLFEQAHDERELGLVLPVQLGFAERRLVEMASQNRRGRRFRIERVFTEPIDTD